MSRKSRRAALWAVAVVALFASGAWWFGFSPLEADPDVDAALAQGSTCVEGCGWTFGPTDADVGIVLYTGARVVPEAYAPLAVLLAESGYLVVVPRLTLNFAVFDQDRAAEEIDAHPEVDHWVVAGHSLGGAMAARFAASDDRVEALILLAAYPEEGLDLSTTDLAVLTISASEDGLATPDEIAASLERLPADTVAVVVAGGNHAQFGWYGAQRGDGEASLTREEQLIRVADAIRRFLVDRVPGA